jgi:hypothetical protein
VNRRLIVAAPIAAILLLTGCMPSFGGSPPEPDETAGGGTEQPRFAARQLDAIGLTIEDFSPQWRVSTDTEAFGEGEGDEAAGGGPGGEEIQQGDPCAWSSNWLPDPTQFYTHSWRTFTTGDGGTFAQDWITAIEPGTDPAALLATLRDTISACPETADPAAPGGTVTMVPDILGQFGDGSFSYRADFAHPQEGGVYGAAEVHTVLCGQLWVHLSYIGWDPFVERDALLATMLERAAPIGGCSA